MIINTTSPIVRTSIPIVPKNSAVVVEVLACSKNIVGGLNHVHVKVRNVFKMIVAFINWIFFIHKNGKSE